MSNAVETFDGLRYVPEVHYEAALQHVREQGLMINTMQATIDSVGAERRQLQERNARLAREVERLKGELLEAQCSIGKLQAAVTRRAAQI
jgi:peptidoglycan hydrolase CwlO-like protein